MKPKISSNYLVLLIFVLPCFCVQASAAAAAGTTLVEQSVRGTVRDETGAALIGATVSLKGVPATGTITDVDGNYELTVPDGNAVLVFSFIGYQTLEEALNGRSVIDVSLSPDVSRLNEVVVIGYGTQRKSDLTGALISAPLESFAESPNTNILQSLAGSTPGISIGQTSTAGEEPEIQIRGQSSLNGNQDPLIILDGVYYRGRLSDLNPKDIASVDVLKDASSKAVYGAQAANGVILITTKNGKTESKPVISYATYYSTQSPANELTMKGREAYLKGVRDIDWQNGYLGPDFTQENPSWTVGNNTGLFPPLLEGLANGTDYSWYDEVTDPGHISDHQLSVRGRGGNTSYFLSGGYTDQQGWILNDVYNRITARVNIDVDVTNWLTLGANTFGSFSDYSGESPDFSALPQMSPLAAPRDANGNFFVNPLGDNRLNPFLQSASDDRDLRNNISGIFYAKVQLPVRGLSYRVNFSNNYRWDALSNSSPYDAGLSGRAIKINRSTYDVLLDNILSYDRRFGDDHGLNLTLLYGANRINFDENRAEGTNFTNLTLSYNSLEQAVIQNISSAAWEEKYLYQMARINYDLKNKYLLTGTVRRDGFSGFAENNKVGIFPSLGLGWVLSKESFLENSKFFNFLKLRASYGVNGNLTTRYSSLARVAAGENSQYVFGDGGTTVNGQQIASLANPNLSWERTAGINLGLDFSLWAGKLSGSIDYYKANTTDLLWNFILPQITGFGSITSNIGEISNRGVEVLLNASLVSKPGFSWDIGVNVAANNNRIESLLGLDLDEDGREDDLVANGLFIGEPIGTIYDYEVTGIYQIRDMDDIPAGFFPGQYQLRDLNGDGQIKAEDDRRILGRREPAYELGLQNTLRFGDFAFKFFIKTIQGGSDGYLNRNDPWASGYGTPGVAQSSNWYQEINYWSPDNADAVYRLPGTNAAISGQRYFARNFIRLQDISLAYDLNDGLVKRLGLQQLKVYISGKNLLTITDWEGWDPETGQGLGTTGGRALPVMKGVSFGLDISL